MCFGAFLSSRVESRRQTQDASDEPPKGSYWICTTIFRFAKLNVSQAIRLRRVQRTVAPHNKTSALLGSGTEKVKLSIAAYDGTSLKTPTPANSEIWLDVVANDSDFVAPNELRSTVAQLLRNWSSPVPGPPKLARSKSTDPVWFPRSSNPVIRSRKKSSVPNCASALKSGAPNPSNPLRMYCAA